MIAIGKEPTQLQMMPGLNWRNKVFLPEGVIRRRDDERINRNYTLARDGLDSDGEVLPWKVVLLQSSL